MHEIKTITAVSKATDPAIASQELYQQLNKANISFVLFYCSSTYSLYTLAQNMERTFTDIDIVGCTTAGEVTNQGYEQHSIVAIGFSSQYFAICATLIESMEKFDTITAQSTINELVENCQSKELTEIKNNSFLLTLLDGLSSSEEQFLVTLNSAARAIPHFGGSAGDDINLTKTHVYYHGNFYRNAAIVIMVNTILPFEVFTCHHIKRPIEKLVVTDADAANRTVYELNAEPAALEYAKLLNVDLKDLSPEVFSLNPLAVKVGGDYYIRSIQKVNETDLSLTFYCAVDVGIVLTAVEMGDIFSPVTDKLGEISKRYGAPELVLTCDCFLRRLEIEQKGLEARVKTLNAQYNIVGFNTYGEHTNGIHLNQTFTGVYIAGGLDE
ncbi:nitric oxide-sensing protein NosP [Colwellia sp. PAMC 21821]|uniref:nitric oxide-sensing protein NosP n=1 Tax=Colwellia sp. PAMC 21821 TaxID=1816219 RepID=UPI0009BE9E68|nr:nitric oxide-sensing protein NosP [Colwellia sp. PAMC 21821]ARD43049.1 GfdT protein [Colwellia sp. PAMC 21821]